ncbi:MAG: SLC13 family permease [Desulfobacterales bacterium]
MDIWIVSIILLTALVLLITEKFSVDLIAIGIIVSLMLTRVISPFEAVEGFSNPAVITVAAMFLLSQAMVRTGALGFVTEKIIAFSGGNPKFAFLMILVIVGVSSAFINNTPVVVLFIPIILKLSCEYDLSPSKILIPMSYASILAGTCTLIGTSTNIIIKNLSEAHGYGGIGMFELSSLGVPIALLGIAFIYFASNRMMPSHAAPICELEDRADKLYLAEFLITPKSPMIGKDLTQDMSVFYPSLQLYEIIRDSHILYPYQKITAKAGDILLVKGTANDFVAMLQNKIAELPHGNQDLNFSATDKQMVIVELMIPPQSSIIGEKLLSTSLQRDPDIHIIAVKRRQVHYAEQKLRNMRIRIGDIILVRCKHEALERLRSEIDFIPIEDVHHQILHKRKAKYALMIFTVMVAAATAGLADIMVCAMTAVFCMIITGCLQLKDAYRALRGDVLLLIAGTIALSIAMEKSGASDLYAKGFLSIFSSMGPQMVLAGIIVLSSIGTQLLSNNATAVLLLPIAISTALSLGVNPRPFIMAVCFGASACFATPIGYQTNLMVYGPGNYRFVDYLKMGIPLNILVLIMGTFFIPFFWPF